MTGTKIALEAMEKDLMRGGIFLKGRRQKKNGNALLLTKFFQPSIRVE